MIPLRDFNLARLLIAFSLITIPQIVLADIFSKPPTISESRISSIEKSIDDLMASVSSIQVKIENNDNNLTSPPSLDALAEQMRSEHRYRPQSEIESSEIRGTFNGHTLYKKDDNLYIEGDAQ